MGKMPWVIYPRAMVAMKVLMRTRPPRVAEEFEVKAIPSSMTITRNPHTQSNACEVEIDQSVLPFDPRQIEGIWLTAFMGLVKTADGDIQQKEFIRFVGYADKIDRSNKAESMVKLELRDLSTVLREDKHIPLDRIPKFTDTALQAIRRLRDAKLTDDQLEIVDKSGIGDFSLASLVEKRGQKGHVPIKPDASYWEAIEHVAGMANLLVDVDLGRLVLRKPADAFRLTADGKTPARYTFQFGDGEANVMSVDQTKKFIRNRKGILVTAFDPKTRRVVEGKYPPDKDILSLKRPKPGSGKTVHHRAPQAPPKEPDRDVITVGDMGVASKDALNKIAERFYRERVYQEMEGKLETINWDGKHITDAEVDIFDLVAGDRIEVSVRPDLAAELRNLNDRQRAVDYLRQRLGIEEAPARILVDRATSSESEVYAVRTIRHSWSRKGSARTSIDFITIIEV